MPTITSNEVLKHPVRRAVLEHVGSAGEVTSINLGLALGEMRRGVLANHVNRLEKFGLLAKEIRPAARKRELALTITERGRMASKHRADNGGVNTEVSLS